MPTCESCNKTVTNGQPVDHWICGDCRMDEADKKKEKTKDQ